MTTSNKENEKNSVNIQALSILFIRVLSLYKHIQQSFWWHRQQERKGGPALDL